MKQIAYILLIFFAASMANANEIDYDLFESTEIPTSQDCPGDICPPTFQESQPITYQIQQPPVTYRIVEPQPPKVSYRVVEQPPVTHQAAPATYYMAETRAWTTVPGCNNPNCQNPNCPNFVRAIQSSFGGQVKTYDQVIADAWYPRLARMFPNFARRAQARRGR